MKLVWVVYKEGNKCLFEHFLDAWYDFKSHKGDLRIVYPKLITKKKFNNLSEFTGW